MPAAITEPSKQFTPPKLPQVPNTPEFPKEPPADVLKQEFKMDDSIFKADGDTRVEFPEKTTSDKKPDETPDKQVEEKKEEKKEEIKKPSILKPPPGKKEEAKPDPKAGEKKEKIEQISPVKDGQAKRDYTGFSDDEAKLLKQMSNEGFSFASKLIRENKELAKAREEVFYQHPEAFTLTPKYKELQSNVYFANLEAQYYRDVLTACKKGEPFKELKGFDKNTLQPVFGAEIKPTEETEEIARGSLYNLTNTIKSMGTELQEMESGHGKRIESDMKAINAERAVRFGWVQNPELMDYTLNIEGIGDVSLKQIKSDFANLFPAYLRNNPGVEVASDLMIAMRIQKAELDELKRELEIERTKKTEAIRQEPTSGARANKEEGKEIGGVRTFSLAGMP